jgi:PAS domain S-box-containing protein
MMCRNKTKQQLIAECENLKQQVKKFQELTDSAESTKEENPPESNLRIMLENSQEAVKVIQDEKIKYANKTSSDIYGYSCKEMINKHILAMIYHEDHEKVMNNHRRRMSGEKVAPYPYRIVDNQGNVKWIEVAAVLSSWKGKPAVITFIKDITRRVHAEEELKKSRRLLFDIIDFLPDATFAIDSSGKVIIWNKRMEEMLDIKAADMIGKDNYEYSVPFYGERRPILIDLISKPNKSMEKKYAVFKREEYSLYSEGGFYLDNERYYWLRATASLVYDHNENIVGAIESIRDMTFLKNAENELKKKSFKLEETNTALEEANTAMRVLLKHRENDKSEMEEKIVRNIRELVLPYLEKLKNTNLNAAQANLIGITEAHLKEIISSFLLKMVVKHPELTPREIQIASLIKDGCTTKEISEILHLETTTINNHRRRMRKKMTLHGKEINLRSYLMSLPKFNEDMMFLKTPVEQ